MDLKQKILTGTLALGIAACGKNDVQQGNDLDYLLRNTSSRETQDKVVLAAVQGGKTEDTKYIERVVDILLKEFTSGFYSIHDIKSFVHGIDRIAKGLKSPNASNQLYRLASEQLERFAIENYPVGQGRPDIRAESKSLFLFKQAAYMAEKGNDSDRALALY